MEITLRQGKQPITTSSSQNIPEIQQEKSKMILNDELLSMTPIRPKAWRKNETESCLIS